MTTRRPWWRSGAVKWTAIIAVAAFVWVLLMVLLMVLMWLAVPLYLSG